MYKLHILIEVRATLADNTRFNSILKNEVIDLNVKNKHAHTAYKIHTSYHYSKYVSE